MLLPSFFLYFFQGSYTKWHLSVNSLHLYRKENQIYVLPFMSHKKRKCIIGLRFLGLETGCSFFFLLLLSWQFLHLLKNWNLFTVLSMRSQNHQCFIQYFFLHMRLPPSTVSGTCDKQRWLDISGYWLSLEKMLWTFWQIRSN